VQAAKRKRDNLVQTGVRLEPEMLDRLRTKRGLSDEIRDRLERTFALDEDTQTREVIDFIINMARSVAADYGAAWHTSPKAHKQFVTALNERLDAYAPPDEQQASADLFGPTEPPEIMGRIRERDDRRQHHYPHLQEALKRLSAERMSAVVGYAKAKKGEKHE
jgi:hypothetical protein